MIYSGILGEEASYVYRTSLYLAASASAEFIADIALSPMEAAKVKIQTTPGFADTLRQAWPRIMREEGLNGFYKSLVPLWMRQIPYTMMKFACFERTVELLYRYVVPKPRAECSKPEQLVVTFAAGYIAGVFCAIVSHPADTVVSKLNQEKGSTALEAAKKLGFAGMWKGLMPRIVMIGTLTAAQWFIYDAFKVCFFFYNIIVLGNDYWNFAILCLIRWQCVCLVHHHQKCLNHSKRSYKQKVNYKVILNNLF